MDFSTAWIVLLFFVLFFLKTKDAAAAALFGVLNFVNCLFAMQISRIVMGEMLKVRDPAAEQLFLFAFIGVVAYLAGRLFRGGGSRNGFGAQHLFSLRQRIWITFGNMCMMMGGVYLSLFFFANAGGGQDMVLHTLLLTVYMAVIVSSHRLYTYTFKKEMEKRQLKQELGQLEKYADSLEDVLHDMRIFKHDYANILSTLQGFIEEEKYEELKTYFYRDVCAYSDKLLQMNTRLSLLGRIKITPLKGMISSKMLKALAEQIDVFVDIEEDIHEVDISALDLCRIMGILLDNAIEAARETTEPIIRLGIVSRKDKVLFIVQNSCPERTPPIYKMFEAGFSTKGENRGIGLPAVRELLDRKYPEAILDTEIDPESMTLTQRLAVRTTVREQTNPKAEEMT